MTGGPITQIRKLSDLRLAGGSDAPMNVCVVSSEFIGPVKNGGIATATSGLLRQLAADGHKVTLLYTLVERGKPSSGDQVWQHWVDRLAADRITLEHIPHEGDYLGWRAKSWHVREFIGQQNFDVVYFNDHHGSGYYALAAKRAGLAPFASQLHCIITHGSIEWVFDVNDQYAFDAADLEMIGMERRSVEWADVVIGPSAYLLRQYASYGWRLPEQTFQQFYPLFGEPITRDSVRRVPISELVFFGRLEVRKGLWLFCEALDRLADRLAGKTVTFLGRMTNTSGISSGLQIISRSAKWPFRVKMLTDFDADQALAYLREPGRLAVMPSLADNSPCVVYECMQAGIPFISTLGSGTAELVAPDCWDEAMVSPTASALTDRLADILDRGARLARPRYSPAETLATWSAWHRYLAENRTKFIKAPSLAQNLASTVADQNRPLIVIVDRGFCSLSLLVDNLASHRKRLGDRAAYLVLSERRGELQTTLFELFGGGVSGGISIANPEALDDALQLMLATPVVFFVDAELEIATPFFMMAISMLKQGTMAVSCVAAVRAAGSDALRIEQLPAGDLPGLGALGMPIGSAAWAISTAALATQLSSLAFYDPHRDELVSSASLGQELLYHCALTGKPFRVLPVVGATHVRESGGDARADGRFDRTVRTATALRIAPSVHGGGAPWFAISRFGRAARHSSGAPVAALSALSQDHPLVRNSGNGEADLAELAAALARPELALQIETGAGGTAERVRHLMDVAAAAIRLRPRTDLAELLRNAPLFEFGRTALPEQIKGTADPSERTANHGEPRIYVDRRLQMRGDRLRLAADLREKPGKLFVIDVPLCGNSVLYAKFAGARGNPVAAIMTAIDQRNGEVIGTASTRQAREKAVELSIPLGEIYQWAMVQLELSGPIGAEFTIEALGLD